MGPKPIQDVALPKKPSQSVASQESGSSPELVNNIPVRAPSSQATLSNAPATSFIISEEKKPVIPQAPDQAKNTGASENKSAKPKPTAAILLAAVALICLAIGAYLSLLANR